MNPPAIQTLSTEATAFLILFARVGAVLMVLPIFSDDAIPGRIRLMIAFGMTAGLWGLLSPYALPAAQHIDAAAAVVLAELLTGLALGMLVRIMYLAIATAGSIISLQVGLTSAIIADPSLGGQSTVLGKVLSVAAAVVCLGLLVHHLWIAALIRSYAVFPVDGLPPAGDFAELAIRTVGRSLALAVGLAAPMLVYGIVFNVALGLAARLTPSIQVFFVGQPLNLLLGLALFAALFGAILSRFADESIGWIQLGWR